MQNASPPPLTILNHRFYPELTGGVEWRLWHTARALADHGCPVEVLTQDCGGRPVLEEVHPGVVVRRFAPPDIPTWAAGFERAQWLRMMWWLKVLRRVKPRGVLWTNGYPMPTLAACLAGMRRRTLFNPSICVSAERRMARCYPQHQARRLTVCFEKLDAAAFRLAPLVVLASQNMRQQMVDGYGMRDNVHVVVHGVHRPSLRSADQAHARRNWDITPGAFVVGCVGTLHPGKDIPFLLRAFAQASLPAESRLMIVGDGSKEQALREQATSLGIAQRIVWTGRLADPTPAYAAMDAMVSPSVYEPFGNVLMEAMAAGVPVVARRRLDDPQQPILTAADELIDHQSNGLLVNPHDPSDLAAALRWLAEHRDACRAMGRRAFEGTQQQTWSRAAAQYLDLFAAQWPTLIRPAQRPALPAYREAA